MDEAIAKLEELRVLHQKSGEEILKRFNYQVYPCTALCLSTLNRSLSTFDSFVLLMKNDQYLTSIALLKMQLDNLLRLYGVFTTSDPDETSRAISKGRHLCKLKGKSGKKLKDGYLKKVISEQNPWFETLYNLCSGSIHLSDEHFRHMFAKTTNDAETNITYFTIGSSSNGIEIEEKIYLINNFGTVTSALFALVGERK